MIRAVSTPAAPAQAQAADPKREQLKVAAQKFEAVFLRQMIGSMRQASLGDELLGSSSTDQFREMSDAHLADDMSKKGSFGIAEMLLKQFDHAAVNKAGGK